MDKYEIVRRIENFAPLELVESWDCSGWLVETRQKEVEKIMLALTVTQDVINQALETDCDMIISHHPLFYLNCPFELDSESLKPKIDIYCAHTNLDKAHGGTTDTLIDVLGLSNEKNKRCSELDSKFNNFLRYVEFKCNVKDFAQKLFSISPNLRYVNNKQVEQIHKIVFCAGSGSDFIEEAQLNGADAFVTGDIKFHTALDSEIVLFDIGHFESEILVLKVLEELINKDAEVIYAKENSPFL